MGKGKFSSPTNYFKKLLFYNTLFFRRINTFVSNFFKSSHKQILIINLLIYSKFIRLLFYLPILYTIVYFFLKKISFISNFIKF